MIFQEGETEQDPVQPSWGQEPLFQVPYLFFVEKL